MLTSAITEDDLLFTPDRETVRAHLRNMRRGIPVTGNANKPRNRSIYKPVPRGSQNVCRKQRLF